MQSTADPYEHNYGRQNIVNSRFSLSAGSADGVLSQSMSEFEFLEQLKYESRIGSVRFTAKKTLKALAEENKDFMLTLKVPEDPNLNSIIWAHDTGIMPLFADGSFQPDKYVSNREMAVILYSYIILNDMAKAVCVHAPIK